MASSPQANLAQVAELKNWRKSLNLFALAKIIDQKLEYRRIGPPPGVAHPAYASPRENQLLPIQALVPMYNVAGVVKRFSRDTCTSASRERSQGRSDGFCRTVHRRPLTPRTARHTEMPTKPCALSGAWSYLQDPVAAFDQGSSP